MSRYTHPEFYAAFGLSENHTRKSDDDFTRRFVLRTKYSKSKLGLKAALSIINECTADCGENVGSSTTSPAAPEVAADEEDDGDGDGDPDPDRQPQRHTRITRSTLPPAQLSRPKAACALLGIGRTKLHQLSERDPRFPRKIVLGPRCVGWRTDALLDYLRACEQEG